MSYNPYDWYWLADDNRVFASARQIVVDNADAAYIAWTGAGNVATPWPRDAAGNQTNAAMQEVLTPFNLFIDLKGYAGYVRSNHAGGGVIVTSLSPVAFLSDPVSRNTLANADAYAKANPGHMTDWKLSDGSFIRLSEAQLATALNAMATFVQSCFTCESNTATGITGGSITTHAQVDAAFAAISNTFP
jgi:hypothetical protein